MEAWDSIGKAVDYAEEHLADKIAVEDLAKTAFLSPFYFQRLFKRLVGVTVAEYIKLRRLAKIADELKAGKSDRIVDLCFGYGFENYETFSRSFKEAYGITPSGYRSNPVILAHFNKPDISLQYHIVDEDVPIVTDGVVLEVTRTVLKSPKYFAGYITTGELQAPGVDPMGAVWQRVHKTKKDIAGYMPRGNEIGVNLNLAEGTNAVKYFAGVEVAAESIDDRLERYILERGKYVVCKFEAEDFHTLITDTIGKVYGYMYLWVKNKKAKVKPVAIELYYGSSPESSYMELWIPPEEEQYED